MPFMKTKTLFQSVDLTVGTPWKVILRFAIPIFISIIFQNIYSMVDAMIVGHYLPLQFAGVSDTNSLVFIILQFAFGCTAGFSVITGRNFGRKDYPAFRRSFANMIAISLIISLILTLIATVFADDLLAIINVTPENDLVTYKAASTYLSVIYIGLITMVFYNLIVSVLRSIGDSITPLFFLILSSIINIGLDFLFVTTFKGPDAKVAGAAIATVISQAISAIMCFVYSFKKYDFLRLKRSDFSLQAKEIKELLIQGLPLAFQFSILAIGLIILQGAINTFDIGKLIPGTDTPAHYAQDGYGAAGKMDNFLLSPFAALGTAMLSFTAQNYGANNIKRIKQGLNQAFLIVGVTYVIINIMSLLLSMDGFFLYIFINESNIYPETIYYATTYMHVALPSSLFLGVLFVSRNTIQGLGKSLYPFLAGVMELIARILICLYIPYLISPTNLVSNSAFVGICFADPLAWFAAIIVLLYGVIKFVYLIKDKKTNHQNELVNKAN